MDNLEYKNNNQNHILAWERLCKKEFTSIIIMEIITAILFVVLLILKLLNKESVAINCVFLLSLCFFTASSIYIVYMLVEKNLFLKNENVDLYTYYILYQTVMQTPTEVITTRFIIKRLSITKPIDFAHVKHAYRKKMRLKSSAPDQIVICMDDDKKRVMRYRNSFSDESVNRLVRQYRES